MAAVPCLLSGLAKACPETLVEACMSSRTLSKAQNILGNWGGRGLSLNFYPCWSLCPNYLPWWPWWFSSPAPGWPAVDSCFPSIPYCFGPMLWAPGSLVEKTELFMGQKTEELVAVEKNKSSPRDCPSSPGLGPSLHLPILGISLISPVSGSYPSQPGSDREILSNCATLQTDGSSFLSLFPV